MRKFTLHAFEGLMTFNDNELYRYGPVCKTAGDLVRLVSRVQKDKEALLAEFTPKYEEYQKSDSYLALQKEISTAEQDEEEYKKDTDPEGYQKYMDLLTGKLDLTEFVARVARINA